MGPFRRHNRSRFIYNLRAEVLVHRYNLQRALNGLDSTYVPTSGQRERIGQEQSHLDSIMLGIVALIDIWHVTPKPGREVPGRMHVLLAGDARRDTMAALAKRRASFTQDRVDGLEDLLQYLDMKVCLHEQRGQPCPRYSSRTASIGYLDT